MNYYIKGDPDNPQGVKKALEKMGAKFHSNITYSDRNDYFLLQGDTVMAQEGSIAVEKLLATHPDWQELEPETEPEPKFKVGDIVRHNGGIFVVSSVDMRTAKNASNKGGYTCIIGNYRVGENFLKKVQLSKDNTFLVNEIIKGLWDA